MSIEITDEMPGAFNGADFAGCGNADWEDSHLRVGIAAVLALPEVRQAIHDDVRRETEAKLRDLGVTGYSVEYDR
jgi:hypothetical protein